MAFTFEGALPFGDSPLQDVYALELRCEAEGWIVYYIGATGCERDHPDALEQRLARLRKAAVDAACVSVRAPCRDGWSRRQRSARTSGPPLVMRTFPSLAFFVNDRFLKGVGGLMVGVGVLRCWGAFQFGRKK